VLAQHLRDSSSTRFVTHCYCVTAVLAHHSILASLLSPASAAMSATGLFLSCVVQQQQLLCTAAAPINLLD
jgi:hypothetical protein